jgi:CDP-glucose 4,6-dehydratase
VTVAWRHRPVCVTGATGLLGAWLTAWLVERGAHVVGLVRDTVPRSNFYRLGLADRVVVVRGALEDYDLLERMLNEYEIEVIFHLGAQTLVGIANANPRSTFSANILGTVNVLEAARRSRTLRAVIVASSDKAYGAQAELPYREDAPLIGRHPYDVSKSCADLIAQAYWASYRTPVAVTRCGNFFGGGDLNWNRLVPGTIRSLLDGERPVIRSDGTLRRDYIYIKDAVGAYALLAEKLLAGEALGRAYNFSNESPMTVLEMVTLIGRLMRRDDLTPLVLDEASNEIPHQFLSAARARSELGWKPEYTLEDGLAETIAWYREFLAR